MIFRVIWALPQSTFIFRWSQIDPHTAASNIRVYTRLRLCAVVPAAFEYGGSPHTGHKRTHAASEPVFGPRTFLEWDNHLLTMMNFGQKIRIVATQHH
jgi:hypothetical protein